MSNKSLFRSWSYALIAGLLSFPGILFAQPMQSSDSLDVYRDIEYANVGGYSLKLDLYIPQGVPKPMPVVMWVHGGGWEYGSKNIPMVLPLVPLGFAVASIDYRFSQQAIFPAQIYDCKAAVRWLRMNAPKYGFNPNRIAVAGASAGGHLVSLLGTTSHPAALEGNEGNLGVSSEVQAVCDFFGPSNFTDMSRQYSESQTNLVAKLFGGPIDQKMDMARMASPVTYVNAQSAPFYIAHGDSDPIVPVQQSIELATDLKKAGVPVTLYIVKGGGHGFHDPAAFAGAVAFLQKYLKGP